MPSEAQKKARDKWDKENMCIMSCKVKKELSDQFKDICRMQELSPNAVLRELITQYVADHAMQE